MSRCLRSSNLLFISLLGLLSTQVHAQRALLPNPSGGAEETATFELDAVTRSRVIAFVSVHPSFKDSKVTVSVGRVGQLPSACDKTPVMAFSTKARPWGAASVNLRCDMPQWSITIPVQTQVKGAVVLARQAIAPGSRPGPEDFRLETLDITRSPPDIARSITEVQNRHVARLIPAEAMVQLNSFREPAVIRERDTVSVQVAGKGFQVSGEGIALDAAGVGETIRVRMPDGKVVKARVIRAGVAELGKD